MNGTIMRDTYTTIGVFLITDEFMRFFSNRLAGCASNWLNLMYNVGF